MGPVWRVGCVSPPASGSCPLCCFQSVMNMMHVISIPYSLMKVNPLSWIQKVCQYKGTSRGPSGPRFPG